MLIDLAEENQRHNEPIMALTSGATSTEQAELVEQLRLLDETCPRYDVYNVYAVLFPRLINSDYPPAQKRSAALFEKRDALLKITCKAPLGRPWDNFYLECRLNEKQRGGFLVRWNAEKRSFKCTILFDSVRTKGMIEIIPDAFEILLSDDDMFSRYVFAQYPAIGNRSQMAAQLVRTSIELLNWDREDVPTATCIQNKKGSHPNKRKQPSLKKSNPTIIKFEPFLKESISGAHRASDGGHASPGLHLVRGHYKNFKFESPRFGQRPVLGTTYGRLWTKPHQSGKSEGGVARTPRAVIKIGEMACAC